MQTVRAGAGQRIDVLIVTAVPEEYAAVVAVDAGAVEGRAWEARKASTGLEMSVRPFVAASGGILWIAVMQALGMGGVEAVSAAGPLVPEHRVRCLAMCGVCAGRRGEVVLGDVIIADRMWMYDTGKLKVEVGEDGGRIERERGDMEMYRLAPPAWKHAAERFVVGPEAGWLKARPRSEDTLDHEERFWREQLRQLGPMGERVALDEMRRAVSSLTLVGGVGSASEAQKLACDEGVSLLLRDLYPGSGMQHVSGLEPDLLGEAMVWRVLNKENAGAGRYLDRVFDGAGNRAVRICPGGTTRRSARDCWPIWAWCRARWIKGRRPWARPWKR